jgi:hypothetical protein
MKSMGLPNSGSVLAVIDFPLEQGEKRRNSAVYVGVNEHVEPVFNADSAEKTRCQDASWVNLLIYASRHPLGKKETL